MLYMVELQYLPEQRDDLARFFEQRGMTGHGNHVAVQGAWVSKSRRCYVLVAASDADDLRETCVMWGRFGQVSSTPVIDIEQIL